MTLIPTNRKIRPPVVLDQASANWNTNDSNYETSLLHPRLAPHPAHILYSKTRFLCQEPRGTLAHPDKQTWSQEERLHWRLISMLDVSNQEQSQALIMLQPPLMLWTLSGYLPIV